MITLNANIGPAKRNDAFLMAQTLLEGGELSEIQKEALYKYFSPAVPKKAKKAWQWVAKAVGVKDVRYYINFLYSDGRRLIGTDGHRMHWIETDLEPGYYCPKTLERVVCDGRFPDIDRVIPERKTFAQFYLKDLKHVSVPTKKSKPIECVEIGDIQTRINKEYLYQAANSGDMITASLGKADTETIYGSNEFGHFVIMPMRK